MNSLVRLLEYRVRTFNQNKLSEEPDMRKVLKAVPSMRKDSNCSIFTLVGGEFKHLYDYTSCRGFLHDRIRSRMSACKTNKQPFTLDKKRSVYVYGGTKLKRLNENSFKLIKDFCETAGYREPRMLLEPETGKILFKLDMNIFKNLYAVSFMWLVFKMPEKAAKSRTFEEFIENYWESKEAQARAKMCLKEWQRIFPRGSVQWDSMYADFERADGGHHDEGMTELLRGKAKFKKARESANKILGGVEDYKESTGQYNNFLRTSGGSASKISYTIK